MKNLIKLISVEGEFSEIRGLGDLVNQIKKRTSAERVVLLQRLNLDDIETYQDFYAIVSTLTSSELQQFAKQLTGDFLTRIIPDYLAPTLVKDLITADNLKYFIPVLKKYSLDTLKNLLDVLVGPIKKLVISALNDLFVVKLKESLTTPDIKQTNGPLSFARWPDDYYHQAIDWTDSTEDSYSDRCSQIISKIDNALHISQVLESPQQLIYLKTLIHLLSGIINDSKNLNYLLSHLTKEKNHLLMNILILPGMTSQQIVTFSEHVDCRYAFLTALFVMKDKSPENLKLIKTSLSINFDSPEARLYLTLISNFELSQDFISTFKQYSFHTNEDKVIRDYLITLMYSIKNNRAQPGIPSNIAPQRKSALQQCVEHLITNDDYKAKICTLPKQSLKLHDAGNLSSISKCRFFKDMQAQTPHGIFENSSLSDKQVSEIQTQIALLQKEINSSWPFPNKDRKLEKIKGLKALLIKATQMDVIAAIEEAEDEYPEIRKGTISTRTAKLLDGIRNEQPFLIDNQL